MNAEDRILVGVINTKRDLKFLLEQRWYRIPQGQAAKGIDADFLAFFISGSAAKPQASGIHYYARRTGIELVRRIDLIPSKLDHPRAQNLYHKIQLGDILIKDPPIINQPNPYTFSFIYTTADRFIQAGHIRDLYSGSDYLVDRVFHVLRQEGLEAERTWENLKPREDQTGEIIYPAYAQIRLIAERGEIVATTASDQKPAHDRQELIYLPPATYLDDVERTAKAGAKAIQELVRQMGGPKTLPLHYDDY